ncbi:hypothetical protein B9T62_30710 [Paenibacillus donghaensis]|uniref:Uncharacterized protein n=1 Tax=Paenibacillus donghaensis TaxID=414771 RepID=A0A2Z2KDE7_9BACL|nr:hypothetical protein B9T62_30710 [Paenibacillus donghaensis]
MNAAMYGTRSLTGCAPEAKVKGRLFLRNAQDLNSKGGLFLRNTQKTAVCKLQTAVFIILSGSQQS